MKIRNLLILALILFFSSISCSDLDDNHFGVNTSHLDYLYEDFDVNSTEMALIHIYSNSPDYIYIDDLDEGSACVDPKRGFASFSARYNAEIRLYHIAAIDSDVIDIEVLRKAGLIKHDTRKVKVINTGEVGRAVTLKGLAVTKGAQAAIEAAGGKVE